MDSENRSKFSQRVRPHDGSRPVCPARAPLSKLKLTNVTDRIRLVTETLYQELINTEVTTHIGAPPFERSHERAAQRKGTRARVLTTIAGDLNLKIPKLHTSFFPALLEGRPGPVRRRDGGLPPRCLDPQSR